jgi:hypothetical protein
MSSEAKKSTVPAHLKRAFLTGFTTTIATKIPAEKQASVVQAADTELEKRASNLQKFEDILKTNGLVTAS